MTGQPPNRAHDATGEGAPPPGEPPTGLRDTTGDGAPPRAARPAPKSATRTLDVRRMRVLREVAARGTIAAAARALSFTPSAVSQQLAALEREAAVPLLDRHGGR